MEEEEERKRAQAAAEAREAGKKPEKTPDPEKVKCTPSFWKRYKCVGKNPKHG